MRDRGSPFELIDIGVNLGHDSFDHELARARAAGSVRTWQDRRGDLYPLAE